METRTTKKPKRHQRVTFLLSLAVLASCLSPRICSGQLSNAPPPITPRRAIPASRVQAESLSQAFKEASNKILPAVVKIKTTTSSDRKVLINGLFPMRLPDQQGLGSGVIIDPSGVVMTNNHVVENADEVIIEMQDGTELYATEYTTDPETDLAIVRVKTRERLPFAQFGDSDALKVGDWVLAVGHPLELETSVSAGIISAKGRSLGDKATRAKFLQTDAAINPGNSGGPLVNLRGEVVGINTAIASQTGGYQGIGFAVPANHARDVVSGLRNDGTVTRGKLGVGVQKLSRELSEQLLRSSRGKGVVVNRVQPGTPAAQAGIKPGDVITHFASYPVDSPNALRRIAERVPLGSRQQLDYVRLARPLKASIYTIRYTEDEVEKGVTKKLEIPVRDNSSLGFQVADLTDLAYRQGIEVNQNAVVITRVDSDSLAADEQLRPGMLVLKVRDKEVDSVDEFKRVLRDEALSDGILLLVRDTRRGKSGGDRFVVLRSY